jgi:cell division cycle 2-like protein
MRSIKWQEVRGICNNVKDDYELIEKIGEGTYGVVYKARDKRTNELRALKKVRIRQADDAKDKAAGPKPGLSITSYREIDILKSVRHESIVTLLDVCIDRERDDVYLVFEYEPIDLADLHDHNNFKPMFSVTEVKRLMLDLFEAMDYLHSSWLIHRDIKMSNLLYDNKGHIKLADFGLARLYAWPLKDHRLTPKVVTLWYRAPELLFGDENYDTAIDMWSLGCVMAELVLGRPVLAGQTELEQLTRMCKLLGTPSERIWPGFTALPLASKFALPTHPFNDLKIRFQGKLSDAGIDLLNKLLTWDPHKRISASEALVHEWFAERPLPKSRDYMPVFSELPRRAGTHRKRPRPNDDERDQSNQDVDIRNILDLDADADLTLHPNKKIKL